MAIETTIQLGQIVLPLTIYFEKRKSWRMAIGRSTIILRLPHHWALLEDHSKYWMEARHWLQGIATHKPQSIAHLLPKPIQKSAYNLRIQGDCYTLLAQPCDKEQWKAQLVQREINVYYPSSVTALTPSFSLKMNQKISALFSKKYKEYIESKVKEINAFHFGYDISSIKLKYATSRWGSCSRKKNLNFSTRLLLAPESVLDYVIIHELAHLQEFNHSARFWHLVAKADSKFEDKEIWLKKYGHQCNFFPGETTAW
jgi:predicted metal-dependent hydrolase